MKETVTGPSCLNLNFLMADLNLLVPMLSIKMIDLLEVVFDVNLLLVAYLLNLPQPLHLLNPVLYL